MENKNKSSYNPSNFNPEFFKPMYLGEWKITKSPLSNTELKFWEPQIKSKKLFKIGVENGNP